MTIGLTTVWSGNAPPRSAGRVAADQDDEPRAARAALRPARNYAARPAAKEKTHDTAIEGRSGRPRTRT
jgi:hypothetical protein